MDSNIKGKIEIKINGQASSVSIIKLFPFKEDETQTTLSDIETVLNQNKISFGINKEVINWYLNKAVQGNIVISDIIIATSKQSRKINSSYPYFLNSVYPYDNQVIWQFFERFFRDFSLDHLLFHLPAIYVKKDEIIAQVKINTETTNGINVYGEEVPAGRSSTIEFYAGENVHFDENKKAFIAGCPGYVYVKDNAIIVQPPFMISSDKMKLHFLNLKKNISDCPSIEDLKQYFQKTQINLKYVKISDLSKIPAESSAVIASGHYPGESVDAYNIIHFEDDSQNKMVDSNDMIDYREIKSFPSVNENQLLATKKLAIKGGTGEDLFGNQIASKTPKDVLLKNGINTFKEETHTELKIFAKSDGIVENKNGVISVFPQLNITSDIDYSSGNIHSKVNVNISGTVRTGFKVESEKNVFINGSIEDNCTIIAGGDIYIQGGSSGMNTVISAGGNLTIKFIEGNKVSVKGNITVQRFILSAKIECGDQLTVMGAGINLNEKGAIIDSEIKIRKTLYVPTIGNDSGIKSTISFAFDNLLNNKIENLHKSVEKLNEQIQTINDQFEVDITSPNIHTIIKGFAKSVKDDIINAIQEKNKIESKLKMMQSMFEKELEIKKGIIESSSLHITKKIFPPLIVECDGNIKTFDSLQGPSKIYYDTQSRSIERSIFGAV